MQMHKRTHTWIGDILLYDVYVVCSKQSSTLDFIGTVAAASQSKTHPLACNIAAAAAAGCWLVIVRKIIALVVFHCRQYKITEQPVNGIQGGGDYDAD